MTVMLRHADISSCGRYRYTLRRTWGNTSSRVTFLMLNPSTADAEVDDPTILKCIALAQHWDYGELSVVNMYAWRSTSPLGLLVIADPVGPENDQRLADAFYQSNRIVLAWGRHERLGSMLAARSFVVRRILREKAGGEIGVLGRNEDGSPKHPLYLSKTTPFTPDPAYTA
jgi:hypothetical protein